MRNAEKTHLSGWICVLAAVMLAMSLSCVFGAGIARAEEGGLLYGLGELLNMMNEKDHSSGSQKENGEEGLGGLMDLIGTIANAEIPMKEVSVSKIADQNYTGKEVRPVPKVTRNGTELRRGTDYTLTYLDNVKVGTAKVRLTGKGRYKGTKTVSFRIVRGATSGSTSKNGKSSGNTSKSKKSSGDKTPGTSVTEGRFTVRISKSSVVYNGEARKPSVKVTVRGKNVPSSGYTVSYKDNKNVGKATVTVKGKGDYKGYSGSASFRITLKPLSFTSAASQESGQLSLAWKKDSQADGYQIQYSQDKSFEKSVKSLIIPSDGTVKKTIEKLSPGQKYYVRIRSFTKTSGRNSYGPFGTVRTVTVKK